tara:strand:+ start:434 stop:817 length:384 start_codon:yes stop_codon:yes gene_type:complete
MESFYSTLGVIVAICIGIMILAVFFTTLSAIKGKFRKPSILKVEGFLNETKKVNLYLNRGHVLRDVTFIGMVDQEQVKNNLPYQFIGMIIIEDSEGKRSMIKSETVRMIEEVDPVAAVNSKSLRSSK